MSKCTNAPGGAKLDLEEDGRDFHLLEYTALRNAVQEATKAILANFVFAVSGSAAVFAWLLSRPKDAGIAPELAIYIPVVVTVLLFLLSIGISRRSRATARYVDQLESRLAVRRVGWERVRRRQPDWQRRFLPFLGTSETVCWAVLVVGDTYGATQSLPWAIAAAFIFGTGIPMAHTVLGADDDFPINWPDRFQRL